MAQGQEAFLAMLAEVAPEHLPAKPEAMVKMFREDWVTEERAPALDSQEAAEAVGCTL